MKHACHRSASAQIISIPICRYTACQSRHCRLAVNVIHCACCPYHRTTLALEDLLTLVKLIYVLFPVFFCRCIGAQLEPVRQECSTKFSLTSATHAGNSHDVTTSRRKVIREGVKSTFCRPCCPCCPCCRWA